MRTRGFRTAVVLASAMILAAATATLAAPAAPAPAAAPAGKAPAAMPAAGTAAPEFTLTTGEGKQTSLSDYRGKWVVLYFYPKDFTSGCTVEAHNFQRDLPKYEQAGAVILGVSVDTPESHKGFCAKEGLAFTLLADPDAKVTIAYGSKMDYKGETYAERNTFLIDPKGTIARVFTKVDPAVHSADVLAAIKALKGTTPAGAAGAPSSGAAPSGDAVPGSQKPAPDLAPGTGGSR